MQNGAYSGPTKRGDRRGPVGDSRISDAAKDIDAGRCDLRVPRTTVRHASSLLNRAKTRDEVIAAARSSTRRCRPGGNSPDR